MQIGLRLVAEPKAKSKPRETRPTPSASIGDAFAAAVGRLVRLARAKRGMTRRQLARGVGRVRALSRADRERAGQSVGDHPEVDRGGARRADHRAAAAHQRAHRGDDPHSRSARPLPPSELPAIAELIEAPRRARTPPTDRARRIALVGLRGAGKSTLGTTAGASDLGCPFIELDRLVEQDYGARIPDLIEIAGLATFRRYERACLERVIAEHEAAVIATAGGIVSNPETYALLLRRTHTVWIKARPEEHMRRVMEQGDFRPMAQNREAMADLVAILDARSADYARAEAELDTSGDSGGAELRETRARSRRVMRAEQVQ